MAARRRLRLGLAFLLAAVACVQNDGSRFNPIDAYTDVSVEQEREIGAEFDRQLREHVLEGQIRLIDDPVVLGFLTDLGQSIVRKIEPQPFIYHFRVIVDPALNAFAVPGGYIYLHSGTILQSGSLDELAGVVAHEIGHVKGRHYARMREKAAIPDLLAKIAGMAAVVATGEPGLLVASEGLNVALQLRFSREFETEADEIGSNFMARAGYHPEGMARFFERIIVASHDIRFQMPPYLYSHPDVEDRIASVLIGLDTITVTGTASPELRWAFREAQARLALLVQSDRTTWLDALPDPDRSKTDPLLDDAEKLAGEGDIPGGLALLEEAERIEPYDPRVPFLRAELLERSGRTRDALGAYRRALAIDPSVALVYYRLGMAYLSLGDRHKATFYLEQAVHRFGGEGPLPARARREIERLTFPPVDAAGIADGIEGHGGTAHFGSPRVEFQSGDPRVVWWGRIAERYLPMRTQIRVRFTDPSGAVVQEQGAEKARKPYVHSTLELEGSVAGRHGIWRVEALLDDRLIDRRTFRLTPALPEP
jgi:predicted Zn-dependent protease